MRIRKVFFFIVLLAIFLRFYQLGKNPPHLNWDEAALGYNAYSLLSTGRDEYGKSFPLSFRSFDDYKPPLYVYLTIPSVAVFGLNDWAVRFPSAFLGVLTVVMMYFLTKEILKNERMALLAMLFLAISPWHLQFSRVAFEANIALFFVVVGVWAFLKAIKKPIFLFVSVISFSFSLYSYHSPRVFVPLLGIGLVVIFRKKLLKNWKYCLLVLGLGAILCFPLLKIMTSAEGQMRFVGTSIFTDSIDLVQEATARIALDQERSFPLGSLIHNRRLVYLIRALKAYFAHFSLKWLFLEGNFAHHHAPEVSFLYLWDLPFLVAGIFFLIKNKVKNYQLILLWLFLAPLPAVFSIDIPHAVRVLNMVIPIHILSAYGIYFFPKKRLLLFSCLLSFNFLFYLHQYYVHMPIEYSASWQYGRQEMVLAAEKLKENYDEIIISPELEKSYIFFLYYLQYDPQKYLAEGGTVSGGYAETGNKVGKYKFQRLEKDDQERSKTLFIGRPEEFPEVISILKTIHYLNGEKAIKFIFFKNEK